VSMAAFAALTAYYGVLIFLDSVRYGVRSNSTLALPLAIPQAIWVVGLVAFAGITFYALGRGLKWLNGRQQEGLLVAARLPDPKDAPGAEVRP